MTPLSVDYDMGPTAKLVICFDYDRGSPGCMYLRNGDPGYPPEPECVEITDCQVWHRADQRSPWINTGVSLAEDVVSNEWLEQRAWKYIEKSREGEA